MRAPTRRRGRCSSPARSATGRWWCRISELIAGPFQITALEYSGSHDGEVVYEIALESAGALSFAAI
jgi:hypothetical protein